MAAPETPSFVRAAPLRSETTLATRHPRAFSKLDSEGSPSITRRDGSSPPGTDASEFDTKEEPYFPNNWARFRYKIREPVAEFLGTMLYIIFGLGSNVQAVTSTSRAVASSDRGSYLQLLLSWGMGTALAVWVSGGISGGHLNPVVTVVQVIFRRFPLRKLPVYVLAQVSGAFTGALLVYATYWRALELFEGGELTVPGTASLFATYPLPYLSSASSFFSEFIGTAILIIVILAVTDKRNGPPPPGLVPLSLAFAVVAIGASLGMQTSFALNPARDFGPRLMTSIFYGRKVWSFRNHYWIWSPILATLSGGLSGAFVYDMLVYTGEDSRINSPRFMGFGKDDASLTKNEQDAV